MRVFNLFLAVILSGHAYAQMTESIRAGYVISGYVVDEQGKPLANMTVRLNRVSVGQYFEAKTDSKGNYFHAVLYGGQYQISIIKDGHSFVLGARIGVQDRIIRKAATVNFDLRELAANNQQQQEKQRVTVAGFRIPRKAEEEFKKAFDAKDDVEAEKRHLENAVRLAPNYGEALNNLGSNTAIQ